MVIPQKKQILITRRLIGHYKAYCFNSYQILKTSILPLQNTTSKVVHLGVESFIPE